MEIDIKDLNFDINDNNNENCLKIIQTDFMHEFMKEKFH
jgi:hypothetical protein